MALPEVIIPTRNAPAVLWLTLLHLFALNARNSFSSVTLLDNCSTHPDSPGVLAFARSKGCVVIRHERDVGVWASINRGLALSQSRHVLVLTSDVLLPSHAVELLVLVMEQTRIPFLGPEVHTFFEKVPRLSLPLPSELQVDTTRYNGACWLMDWGQLRSEVGWFDPGYFVCYGDTDYVERLRLRQVPYGVVTGLPCVHLDKQTRRGDTSVEEDTEMEIRDGARFHQQWQAHPEVLTRHPQVARQAFLMWKRQEGWKEKIP